MADASLEARISLMDHFSGRLQKAGGGVKSFAQRWRAAAGMVAQSGAAMTVAKEAVWQFAGMWGKAAVIIYNSVRFIRRALRRFGAVFRRVLEAAKRRLKQLWFSVKIIVPIIASIFFHAATKIERALRNVTSLMAGAGAPTHVIEQTITSWERGLARMAVRYGIDDAKLADGLYNVVSATFEGADAMKVLDTATMGSAAAMAPLDEMTKMLTRTLQAYRAEGESNMELAEKSTKVMDQYFMALARGQFTMEELARSQFSSLPSMASVFNVPLEQLLAIVSTLTRGGLDLEEVTTGIRQLFVSQASMSPGQISVAEELWGEGWRDVWGPEALAAGGIPGMLDALKGVLPDISSEIMDMAQVIEGDQGADEAFGYLAEKIGVTTELLTGLFPNIRALKVVMALSGPAAEQYANDLAMIGDSAGATERAHEEMAKSTAYQMDRARQVVAQMGQELAGMALPAVGSLAETFVKWSEEMPFAYAVDSGMAERMFGQGASTEEVMAAAQDKWDSMSPWDRLFYTIKIGWTDFWDRVETWLNSEGGKDKISAAIVGSVGAVANVLRSALEKDFSDWGDTQVGGIFLELGSLLVQSVFTAVQESFAGFDWSVLWNSTLAWVAGGLLAAKIGMSMIKGYFTFMLVRSMGAAFTGGAIGGSIVATLKATLVAAGVSAVAAVALAIGGWFQWQLLKPRIEEQGIIQGIGTGIRDMFVEVLTGIFTGGPAGLARVLGEWFVDVFRGAFNSLEEWIEDRINGLFRAMEGFINNAIGMLNNIVPGFNPFGAVDLGSVDLNVVGDTRRFREDGPLRGMADGGVVTRPTRALIGEAGPEAVIPLSDKIVASWFAKAAGTQGSGEVVESYSRGKESWWPGWNPTEPHQGLFGVPDKLASLEDKIISWFRGDSEGRSSYPTENSPNHPGRRMTIHGGIHVTVDASGTNDPDAVAGAVVSAIEAQLGNG